ncbi:MAG: FkbM family methyltransferase [bacterium]
MSQSISSSIARGADFTWLLNIARDGSTRDLVEEIKFLNERFLSEGYLEASEEEIHLLLDKYDIFVGKKDILRAMKDYTEIFRENLHMLHQNFWAEDAKIVVDLGANFGFFTLKVKQNSPDVKIISVEPNVYAFDLLVKNVSQNRLKNIYPVNKAIAGQDDFLNIYSIVNASALSGKYPPKSSAEKYSWIRDEMLSVASVEGITLGHLFEEYNLNHVDLLKIDVQGMELEIITAAVDLLDKVSRIVVEPHSVESREKLTQILTQIGFNLVLDEGIEYGDLYFER